MSDWRVEIGSAHPSSSSGRADTENSLISKSEMQIRKCQAKRGAVERRSTRLRSRRVRLGRELIRSAPSIELLMYYLLFKLNTFCFCYFHFIFLFFPVCWWQREKKVKYLKKTHNGIINNNASHCIFINIMIIFMFFINSFHLPCLFASRVHPRTSAITSTIDYPPSSPPKCEFNNILIPYFS